MDTEEILRSLYDRFNARDIDGALAVMSPDVLWANGMDGGHEHGREAIREYWTRQWAIVSPRVEPMSFGDAGPGEVVVTVRQSVRDLAGEPLRGQSHGLADTIVEHVFRIRDGTVARFDIRHATGREG